MSYPAYESYKDSGVEWLGEVPSQWDIKRLKYLCTVNDETLPENTDPEMLVNYVDISSVNLIDGITDIEPLEFEKAPSRARRIVKDGDTIVSTVRTYLKAIAPIIGPVENLIVSTGFCVVRPHKNVDHAYLGFFLQSEGFVGEVVSKSVGVSYPAINPDGIISIESPLPSIPQQKAIAAFLDEKTAAVDDLIAKKEKLLELLAEKRTALITQAVTKGLNQTAPMKPSGIDWLGDVPERWDVLRIKNIADGVFKNGIFKKREHWGSGTPIVNVTDIYSESGDIYIDELDLVNCSKDEQLKYAVSYGDFFFVRSSLKLEGIGVSATVLEIHDDALVFECHLVQGSPNLEKVDPRFVKYSMKSEILRNQFISMANTVTMTTIDQDKIKGIYLSCPRDILIQNQICDFLDQETERFFNMRSNIESVISKLKEYRTALITNAVTGKIKVV